MKYVYQYWASDKHEEIKKNFRSEYDGGITTLERDSVREKEYIEYCIRNGISYQNKHSMIIADNPQEIPTVPFFYVSFRDFKNRYWKKENTYDLSNSCIQKADTSCLKGIIQRKKIVIEPGRKKYDIMSDDTFRSWIVSSRAKTIIEGAMAKGVSFIPCLEKGREYSETEQTFSNNTGTRVEHQGYWQMLIEEETIQPMNILGDTQSTRQCGGCGGYQLLKPTPGKHSIWFFNGIDHIGENDCIRVNRMQYCNDDKVVNNFYDWFIMSGRLLNAIIAGGITGLRTKKAQVVPILGRTLTEKDLDRTHALCFGE